MTRFLSNKFYTLKVHRSWQIFLIILQQSKCTDIIIFNWVICCKFFTECVKFQQFLSKITLGVCKFCTSTQIIEKITRLAQLLLDCKSQWSQRISSLTSTMPYFGIARTKKSSLETNACVTCVFLHRKC